MTQGYPGGEFLLPLFPLPNVVFFPHTRLPLHVFEPRYRTMVGDALAADERIGVILLRPGWENDYFGSPPVYEYGTLGMIEQAVSLEEGRYNILLNGTVRFRVVELTTENPYRIARVVAAPEVEAPANEALAERAWLSGLARQYLEFLPGDTKVPEIASATLDSLTNALIMSLNIDLELKQELLEEGSVISRSRRVAGLLEERVTMLKFLAPYRQSGDPQMN